MEIKNLFSGEKMRRVLSSLYDGEHEPVSDYIGELISEIKRLQNKQKWIPIESAPTDNNRHLLLWGECIELRYRENSRGCTSGHYACIGRKYYTDIFAGEWEWRGGIWSKPFKGEQREVIISPTHWMELPDDPEGAERVHSRIVSGPFEIKV